MAKERMRSVRPAQENLIDAAGTESYSGDAWLGASDRALASPDIPVTDSLVPAVVVPARGRRVDVEALRSALRERLRSSLTPRIWIWDSLPRTETGKLVRRDIVRTLSEVAD
jgi:acyl-CoA synthetase (AMP-forming)/AMP-acid ligase II